MLGSCFEAALGKTSCSARVRFGDFRPVEVVHRKGPEKAEVEPAARIGILLLFRKAMAVFACREPVLYLFKI